MRLATFPTLVLLLNLVLPPYALALGSPPEKRSRAGESCSRSADCEGELRCVGQICVDSEPRDLIAQARLQLDDVARAVSAYAGTHHKLPLNLQILTIKGFLAADRLQDPWGRVLTYEHERSGASLDFKLCSRGPDTRRSTEDDICAARQVQ